MNSYYLVVYDRNRLVLGSSDIVSFKCYSLTELILNLQLIRHERYTIIDLRKMDKENGKS